MPIIRVDDEVYSELQRRAVELNLVFATPNQVLRSVLGLAARTEASTIVKEKQHQLATTQEMPAAATSTGNGAPSSLNPTVQRLIDRLLPPLQELLRSSGNILRYHPISGKWVAHPNNFVAFKVQKARANNLCLYVYGRPNDFTNLGPLLRIKPERTNYSRFNIDTPEQVREALLVMRPAYQVKLQRGR